MAKDRYFYFNQIDKFKGLKGTVTIIGLQSDGIILAEILSRAGINLRLIDKGRIYLEELQSQSVYLEEDVTKFKAKQAKKRLETVNENVKIKAFHEELTPETAYLLDADVVVDFTNKESVNQLVHDHCLKQKIPCFFVSSTNASTKIVVLDGKDVKKKISQADTEKEGLLGSLAYVSAGFVSFLTYQKLQKQKLKESYELSLDKL